MKLNIKNNSWIVTSIVVVTFMFYKNLPVKIQVFLPLILGVYFSFNIGMLIYQKKYWEEIARSIILFVLAITIFVNYYNSAIKFNDSFMKITLLIGGWIFPCLAYTGVVSWRRKGELRKYRQSLFFLAYCIILAVFCTVIVIVK